MRKLFFVVFALVCSVSYGYDAPGLYSKDTLFFNKDTKMHVFGGDRGDMTAKQAIDLNNETVFKTTLPVMRKLAEVYRTTPENVILNLQKDFVQFETWFVKCMEGDYKWSDQTKPGCPFNVQKSYLGNAYLHGGELEITFGWYHFLPQSDVHNDTTDEYANKIWRFNAAMKFAIEMAQEEMAR